MHGEPGVRDEDVRLGGGLKLLEVRGPREIRLQGEIDLLPDGAVRPQAEAAQVGAVKQGGVEGGLDVLRPGIPAAVPVEAAAGVEAEGLVLGLPDQPFAEG